MGWGRGLGGGCGGGHRCNGVAANGNACPATSSGGSVLVRDVSALPLSALPLGKVVCDVAFAVMKHNLLPAQLWLLRVRLCRCDKNTICCKHNFAYCLADYAVGVRCTICCMGWGAWWDTSYVQNCISFAMNVCCSALGRQGRCSNAHLQC